MGNEVSFRPDETSLSNRDDPSGVRVPPPTRLSRILGSTLFSILMGIIAPIICLLLQPVLLHDSGFMLPGLRFINVYWLFAYGVMGLEILALSAWLAFGPRLGGWCGFLAGVLSVGALFSGGLGLILLPFSIMGIVVFIGILGFVPLFTAYVFALNAVRGYRKARISLRETRLWGSMVLGGILVLGVPWAIQARVLSIERSVVEGIAGGDESATAQLRRWSRFVDSDRLVWAYEAERNTVRKERLAIAYHELTGSAVESRLSSLDD